MDFARLKRGDRVVIIGTSGFALELTGLLQDAGIEVVGCIGPERPPAAANLEYLGGDEVLTSGLDAPFLLAIGQPDLRRKLFERLTAAGGRVTSFVHASAHVSSAASIGEGAIVYPNATVHAGVRLERCVVVNSNVTVGHETSLGPFVTVGPGVSLGGRVRIGGGAYIGIGASTVEGITIAAGSLIGAGAVVVSDCPQPGTYIGVPARLKSS